MLAELARGRLRSKLPALREALEGHFSSHHALVVGMILAVNRGAGVLSEIPNSFVGCVRFLSSFSSLCHAHATPSCINLGQ